ncbi:MAG: glycosyltransferase [Candidatus Nomurabacteria bacterium]|nr:glycosyltransferase [Candidatus Nomurabacteria bacterium]
MNDLNIKNIPNIRILLFWDGFPACGLLIKKVVEKYKDDIVVVATKSKVPYENLEKILGHNIIWLDNANDIWNRKDEFGYRNLIIHTGWKYSGWLKYDRYMKKHCNAKTIVQVDNRYRGDLRQYFGALWFRIYLRKFFDGALVPGKQGKKLMKFLGMKENRIYTGLYGAYEGIFKETTPIEKRNNEFLFVGQLIHRKSVDLLLQAFRSYRNAGGTWNIRIVGSGPLQSICHGDGIILEDFDQPEKITDKMNRAKVLVLPSRDDNWGTVVCEAAACGMQLITSKKVGASFDIVQSNINGITLENIDAVELQKTFFYFENLSEDLLKNGSKISKEIAINYTSQAYLNSFLKIINDLYKTL